jgi:Na+/phosphate symporter
MDGTAWLVVSAVSVLFVLVSTVILLWFAEALVWIALLFLRGFSRFREGRNG